MPVQGKKQQIFTNVLKTADTARLDQQMNMHEVWLLISVNMGLWLNETLCVNYNEWVKNTFGLFLSFSSCLKLGESLNGKVNCLYELKKK